MLPSILAHELQDSIRKFLRASFPMTTPLFRRNDGQTMLDDLRNRLAGKPYIFKLVNRIRDDIERIEEMQKFEAENNVDLGDYVEL